MNGLSDSPELREAVCEVGRRLYARGLCSGFDGNLSCRLGDGTFLCTPTRTCKGFLQPGLLCTVDETGNQRSGSRSRTSEIQLHLAIYRDRPDVQAVVHFHPPCASAFAIAGLDLPAGILAEADALLGRVPLAPFGLPGTAEFADTVRGHLPGSRAILLANHGAVTFSSTLEDAWSLAECLENSARILLAALPLGGGLPLPESAREALARYCREGHY